jgi:hypothetical protein
MKSIETIFRGFMKRLAMFSATLMFAIAVSPYIAGGQALLFKASGDGPEDGFTADRAFGDPEPAYLWEYSIIPDGAKGKAFRAPHSEQKLMTYLAPGNIYAQRGTLSFFVRMRDPVGGMPFKLFFVSYCDYSSLDGTWLRVDYNGMKGFDAFVTDQNMARMRVRYIPNRFPEPNEWTHLAFSWDETKGVRLYMNGTLAASFDTTSVFDAGLGLFQPFGRFATSGTVTSNCGHLRGADIDEIHIYDHMLNEGEIRRLSQGETVESSTIQRTMSDPLYHAEWLRRYGWDRYDFQPPALDNAPAWSIRKVEIHDARDQKKWSWRSLDGIRETNWPDAYNRSSLLGRSDYFIEPDWYCYSTSGKAISYYMPEEPWNYCELIGAAHGIASFVFTDKESREQKYETLFRRPEGRERTFHLLDKSRTGGSIRYVNDIRETPLAEFNVFNITPDIEPKGLVTLSYTVTDADLPNNRSLDELKTYFRNRYPADERTIAVALPARAPKSPNKHLAPSPMPVVHVLIPYEFRDEGPRTTENAYGGFHYTWDGIYAGLDGIAIDIPALGLPPTYDGHIPLNIRIRDPLWPNRALLDISVSLKPNEAKTLWLDTRDRILPDDRSICIDFASPAPGFGPATLEGAKIRLIFKEREAAAKEHEIDRFTQMRDNYGANMTETSPQRTKLEYLQRFDRDMRDLFRINPNHNPGRFYWKRWNSEQNTLPVTLAQAPDGVPLWAFRQTEILRQWRYFLDWWIENRQIEDGEFGGGLSDDGDFANCMPPVALMGILPDKITNSVHRLMDAYYTNGMITNGLNTILTDALHTTEEGINVQSEVMVLEYGDPKIVERLLETSSRYTDITAVNKAGHRHFKSRYFSSTKAATEEPWCWSSQTSYNILAPGETLIEFNGHQPTFNTIREIGDNLLKHAQKDNSGSIMLPQEINFLSDEGRNFSTSAGADLFRILNHWTGDSKYVTQMRIQASTDVQPRIDKDRLAENYASVVTSNENDMYIATEGFPWDDGPDISIGSVVIDRLGGSPIRRSAQFPEHSLSWRISPPYDGTALAILVPSPKPESVRIIVYNVMQGPVKAAATGWNVAPGTWEITEGIDTNGDDIADSGITKRTASFERSAALSFTFQPRKTTVIQMNLKKVGTPYRNRPDLGIGTDDVKVSGREVSVTVHSLGSVKSPATVVVLTDSEGKELARTDVPALEGLTGYAPVRYTVKLQLPGNASIEGLRAVVNPGDTPQEITQLNNSVTLR